jgi:predicted RND superfamily exporter protein
MRSLLGAAVVIALLLWLFLQHAQTAAIALFTNAFPLIAMYGLMGWLGIEVDIATASIGAIGLSFCVDDAVHFAAAYRKQRLAQLSPEMAVQAAYQRTGNAIFFSSLVLFGGFASMGFSSLKTVYLFGLLSCWIIFWALFAQLVLFPMLMARFDR